MLVKPKSLYIVVVIFPSSLLKVGDHGMTHQFSPTLPVFCYWCALHQYKFSSDFLCFLCHAISLQKYVYRDSVF